MTAALKKKIYKVKTGVYFYILKIFLKIFIFIFLFKINNFLVFSNYFNILILKIILKK